MNEMNPAALSRFIWETRYRDHARPVESSIVDSWARVADAVSGVEDDRKLWRDRFMAILQDFRFLPAGRILAGAGSQRRTTLFSCFVMGGIEDSLAGIFEALKEGALTMQQGGGVGYDFSTLRPRGTHARTSGMVASGPVSFMNVWDAMCATILSTGPRGGAMMGTLRCDHPDIEEFVRAKRDPNALRHFNLSVLVTDAFMQAVRNDSDWPLVFPERALRGTVDTNADGVKRAWSGAATPVNCRVCKTIRARDLWAQLCDSAYDCAEPGVLFIDRINSANNLGYFEVISATNPCGEQPLPSYGACNLGSLNLTTFVVDAFKSTAHIDDTSLREVTGLAVRFLDNVIDVSRFPLARQQEQVRRTRRIGLGVTGLADALAMLGLRYDDERGRAAAAAVMRGIRDAAYETSIGLARERGVFPAFDAEQYTARPFIRSLPSQLLGAIRRDGVRNSHLLAIAPAGTISLLAKNVSSGIEPIYGIETMRRVRDSEGGHHNFALTDYAYTLWQAAHPGPLDLPDYFLHCGSIAPGDHLRMQAALQPYVDGAISKTITLAKDCARSEMTTIFETADELGLKGCTVYRPESRPDVLADRRGTDRDPPSVCGVSFCEND
jgi:ribonucleoside-diphosphate reductase alpha chain